MNIRKKNSGKLWPKAIVALIALLFVSSCQSGSPEQTRNYDWIADWGVEESFSIEEDSTAFYLPTSIAFVPNPGPLPKDPLYYVAELFGTIKVVTNDRTVLVFAEDFLSEGNEIDFELPNEYFGLAGLCIAPEHGYIYATFAYRNSEDQLLYNGLVRFESPSQVPSTSYSSITDLSGLLKEFPNAHSHQIGSCSVVDDILYISIGDGGEIVKSLQLNSPYGKILRMNLDGQALNDNPFFQDGASNNLASFVWAYGLRNPYGFSIVEDRIFTADNGIDVDRFIEIERGENYLWDGSDWSIGSRGNAFIYPAVGPANLAFLEKGQTIFPPEYDSLFFLAMSVQTAPGIMLLDYSFDEKRLVAPPKVFLNYRGAQDQILSALALGPDALYFAPMIPVESDTTSVYKIAFNPEEQHPYRTSDIVDPEKLMLEHQCLSCHQIQGIGGTVGPNLDRDPLIARLEERLNSEKYLLSLDQIDQIDLPPFSEYSHFREDMRVTEGSSLIRTWMIYHLLEPKFDNPDAFMPNFGLTVQQSEILAQHLLQDPETANSFDKIFATLENYSDFARNNRSSFISLGGMLVLGLLWAIRQVRNSKKKTDQ
jgi:hypothetical protein